MASTKKPRVLDDSGNELPPPDMTSDVGQLIYLMEYCRLRGFHLGPTVQIGDTVVQLHDLRQTEGRKDKDDAPETDIWSAHGYDEKG